MRKIIERLRLEAQVADEADLGHRSHDGGLDVEVTVPWPDDEYESHGPDGPELTFYVVQDGDLISEAKISGVDLATLTAVLLDLDAPTETRADRFLPLGDDHA